jgi:hypothetical protein
MPGSPYYYEQTKQDEIRVGYIVALKSGGPALTVIEAGPTEIVVWWRDNGQPKIWEADVRCFQLCGSSRDTPPLVGPMTFARVLCPTGVVADHNAGETVDVSDDVVDVFLHDLDTGNQERLGTLVNRRFCGDFQVSLVRLVHDSNVPVWEIVVSITSPVYRRLERRAPGVAILSYFAGQENACMRRFLMATEDDLKLMMDKSVACMP